MAVNDEAGAALEALTADILAALTRIWEQVTTREAQLLADWAAMSRPERLAATRELKALVAQLMARADDLTVRFTATTVPAAYELGSAAASLTLGAATGAADLDAFGALLTQTRDDLLSATQLVRQSTKELIRTLVKDHLGVKFLAGQTAVQVGRDLAAQLEGRGIVAVVYRNGARHGLSDYTAMIARTRSAEAYQLGGLGRMQAAGVAYVELADGPSCGLNGHEDLTKADGLVLPLADARNYLTSHPHCVRVAFPRVDVRTIAEAGRAVPSTTAGQRADQALVEAKRLQDVARRSVAAQRFARTHAGLLTDGPFRAGSVAAMRHAQRVARRAG